jgi:hypothetical protein
MPLRKTASSLTEFVAWAQEIAERFTKRDGYEMAWFRGVASEKYKLVPGLYRSEAGQDENADDELRLEFARRALPLVAERAPRDDWEWYFLMQHYGVPTRLLDWTDSALVALYFAISSVRPTQSESHVFRPAVWALNPWTLNKRNRNLRYYGPVTPELGKMDKYLQPLYSGRKPPKFPIALDPIFIAQRMLVQHSHFTLHGSETSGLEEMVRELKLTNGLFKISFNVTFEDIRTLRQQLALMGVTETAIFPDLNGLGRELSAEYDIY